MEKALTKEYKRTNLKKRLKRFFPIYIMALPGLVYLFINNYMPLPGLVLAFKKFNAKKGIFGSQIDLLIVRDDQVINLCEMKYSGTAYTIKQEDDESIRNRISDLINVTGTKYAIFPTLITTYSLAENCYSANIQSVVTLDDLFV